MIFDRRQATSTQWHGKLVLYKHLVNSTLLEVVNIHIAFEHSACNGIVLVDWHCTIINHAVCGAHIIRDRLREKGAFCVKPVCDLCTLYVANSTYAKF